MLKIVTNELHDIGADPGSMGQSDVKFEETTPPSVNMRIRPIRGVTHFENCVPYEQHNIGIVPISRSDNVGGFAFTNVTTRGNFHWQYLVFLYTFLFFFILLTNDVYAVFDISRILWRKNKRVYESIQQQSDNGTRDARTCSHTHTHTRVRQARIQRVGKKEI